MNTFGAYNQKLKPPMITIMAMSTLSRLTLMTTWNLVIFCAVLCVDDSSQSMQQSHDEG
ncbi:hypothetical protein [Moraxella sp.]|uniref:hypothetical protein n=1 Tax=Moraxella sp. TaxID=479 RepID=UPI0026DAF344|nr:hypothetical protein [Moraxella sp.]MDO4893994.1 hypothetical protein [Moraxella sp.]